MYSKVRKPNREPRIEPHQPETTMETHEPPTEPNRNLNDLYTNRANRCVRTAAATSESPFFLSRLHSPVTPRITLACVSQQLQLPEFSAMKRKLDLPPAPLAQVQAKEILRCSIGPCPKPRLGTKTDPRCSLLQPG